jgi:predicted O-methyltransferase YrrM
MRPSNGYSSLWLADGCRNTGGSLITVEKNQKKHAMALENFRRAGLESWIDARPGNVGEILVGLRSFDLVFLDADRSQYVGWWGDLQKSVRSGGLLVVDKATSHEGEIAPLARAIGQTAGFSAVVAPIGNGQLVVLKGP